MKYRCLFLLVLCLFVAGWTSPISRALLWAADDAQPSDQATATEAADESEPENGETTTAADSNGPADDEQSEAKDAEPDEKPQEDDSTAADKSTKPEKSADKPDKTAKKQVRKKVRLAQMVLKDQLPESVGQIGPFGDLQEDLRKTIGRIDKAAEDDSISGIVLDIRNPAIGFGRREELRGAIKRFRATGKKVYAQLESAAPADYLVACACDEIIMPESGYLLFPGIHAEATFFKNLLAKLGIEADFMHIGPYKGAAEPFTREKMSPPVHENMTSLVDDLYDQMLVSVATERLITVEQVKEAVDLGLMTAQRAKEFGLIDRVAYPDAFRAHLSDTYHAEPLVYVVNYGKQNVDTDFSGPMGFVKLMQVIMGASDTTSRTRGKEIAVVYAVGPIMTGKSEQDPLGGQMMGSTTIVEALQEADKDKQVVAIVLRIDSPGGSALASDLIWRETQRIEKPIVASMGDVAGSGGYYIAMGADKIIAAPGTITGSIGVVSGKFSLTGLYDKVGVTTDTIQRGKNSGIFSGSGKFTKSEREVMMTFMEDIYGQFTSKAAQGRDMPPDELKKLAGGRIYTGRQAKNNGLVDEVGTLEDAIMAAKQLAGLKPDDKVRLKYLPKPVNFFESLFGDVDAEKEVRISLLGKQLPHELMEVAGRVYRLQRVFREPAAFILPFELDIR